MVSDGTIDFPVHTSNLLHMNRMEKLLEKLRRESGTAPTDETDLKQWIADLQSLMEEIKKWLAAGVKEGLIRLESHDVDLAEEDLGPYKAPALTIHFRTAHPRTVNVDPRGMKILGAVASDGKRISGLLGRVDVTCGAARAILVRERGGSRWTVLGTADVWKERGMRGLDALVGEPSRPLDEDTFSRVLEELLQ